MADTTLRQTMIITPAWTYMPGRVSRTPTDALTDLGTLLGRVTAHLTAADTLTLLLGTDAAAAVGLPTTADALPDRADLEAPATAHETAVREAGWRLSTTDRARLGVWTTLTRDRAATIHLGLLDLIDHHDPKNSPITALRSTADMADTLHTWRTIAGAGWYGTAPAAAMASIRATVRYGRRRLEPRWRGNDVPDIDARELDLTESYWRAKKSALEGMSYLHGWDTTQMHLAAARNTPLSARVPDRDPVPQDWRDGLTGWWRIDLEPWPHERTMPSPAGYIYDRHSRQPSTRWVTGPTMQLLQQLRDDSEHPGYSVLDSHTAPADGVLLRGWADRLNGAYRQHSAAGGVNDQALCRAIKASYQRGISHMLNPRSRVYRPDWGHAIIAMARTNLWRRMWTLAQDYDWWPAKIHTDCVYYPSASAEATPPPGVRIAETDGQLGTMRHETTVRITMGGNTK